MAAFLVTGASRGIGLALCKQLAERHDRVIAVCREKSKALGALPVEVVSGVDVSSDADVAKLAQKLRGTLVDVLVNNAGVLTRDSFDTFDVEALRQQFEVNALGPLRVTRALLPLLNVRAKIIIVTSRMGSITDNTAGGYYGYRMSKAAVNMAGVTLARDLHHKGIAVRLIHPGWVKTTMGGSGATIDTATSAKGVLQLTDDLTLEGTGEFWHINGTRLPW